MNSSNFAKLSKVTSTCTVKLTFFMWQSLNTGDDNETNGSIESTAIDSYRTYKCAEFQGPGLSRRGRRISK